MSAPSFPILLLATGLLASASCFGVYDLGHRLRRFEGLREWLWLALGALAIGSTFWAMNLLGTEVLGLPTQAAANPLLEQLAWVAAVTSAALALYAISRMQISGSSLLLASVGIGIGICATRYLSLWSLIGGAPLRYHANLMTASALIAIGVSAVGLLGEVFLQKLDEADHLLTRLTLSLGIGAALCGAHFIGLAATPMLQPHAGAIVTGDGWVGIVDGMLAALLLGAVSLGSALDDYRALRSRLHLERLRLNAAAMRRLY